VLAEVAKEEYKDIFSEFFSYQWGGEVIIMTGLTAIANCYWTLREAEYIDRCPLHTP
jgi:hypothetical protein